MSGFTFKQANKRYILAFFPVMLVYVALCFLGPFLMIAHPAPPKWVIGIIGVLTASPIAIVFWLIGRYVRETDEYTRRIQVEALLTGGGVTLSIAAIWSFLELYQVAPRLRFAPSMMFVGPTFFFFYGLTSAVNAIRRRRATKEKTA